MAFLYLKAVHIIFIVTWFAGLFYMPRLLIYLVEAYDKPEQEKAVLLKYVKIWASRLWYGITWPSAVITLGMGASLLITQPGYLQQGFMHIKLTLVFLLYIYHFSIHRIFNQLRNDTIKYTSQQLRMWNEVATLFLISIVFIIVLKNALSMVWGLLGLGAVTFLILIGIKIYKKYRKNE
ncbi:CopD family protein [Chryseosolibacter indicus]|uniref:Protoporphyrinogen IX oxidase n=1 Tax=Chryseosolibacter indicus TaxID=2782351 RepID=A0ABS5VKV8_9BACT|nr:CopD family protein [Chryseosolibacter indicus]MBT1702077.1 CopD family protein [Chryseosolibacter indicus]